ncbi:sn-glycerol-3-phosphate transporter [Marinobacter sp. LQ44]|nr:sn-glycerol-3-phosphate transporter [Marinobacter sp. LQ44]
MRGYSVTRLLIFLISVFAASAAYANETRWLLQTSVFTSHHNPKPEHNNDQKLVGLEYTRENDWVVGGASFLNSFSQRSAYVFTGRYFDFGPGPVFAKVTGGLMHGYRGEYRDKIPLNHLGVAPAIIPAVGVRGQYVSSELSFLGAAAVMITTGLQF